MFRVFVEGYEMPCARVQVETGIGPLSAQIVIPPGSYRRRILPGSRVMCFVKDGGEWYEWFQGTTVNMPETSLGLDENPVSLNVIGDLGLLQTILMNYLTIGQVDVLNQTWKSTALSGRPNIFRGGLEAAMGPFATTLGDAEISFGDRILGILQAFIAMDPQGWEDLRRLQYFDRLAIEMAEDVANISNRTLLGSISQAMGSIQTETFTALDILNMTLQLSMHELVSIAPVRFSGTQEMRKVERFRHYLPRGMSLDELANMQQKDLVTKLCSRTSRPNMLIDHLIKPVDRLMVPEGGINRITKGMYNNAYISDSGITRSILKFSLMAGTKPVMMYEQLMPEQIKTVYDCAQAATYVVPNSPSLGAVSSVMSERITGFRTNKEKVYGGVKAQTIGVDPRINHVLHALANAEERDSKTGSIYQKDYIDAWMRAEHEKVNGSSVTIQNATLNLRPIPGFAMEVEDFHGKIYTGKLVRKIDVIDLGASIASSTYLIESCKSNDAINYDGSVDIGMGPMGWFPKFGSEGGSYTSPIFDQYKFDQVPLKTIAALTNFAPKEIALAHAHIYEENERYLAPEKRFTRSGQTFTRKDDGKLPGLKAREAFFTEEFYSDFDLLGEIAFNSLRPAGKGTVIIDYSATVSRQSIGTRAVAYGTEDVDLEIGEEPNLAEEVVTYTPVATEVDGTITSIVDIGLLPGSSITISNAQNYPLPNLNLTVKEAVALLDTKNGNIFSVLAKILGDETIQRKEAEVPMKKIQKTKTDWIADLGNYIEEYNTTSAAETAAVENARIDGLNNDLRKMYGQYNPNFPIYLGNPSPLRIELLFYMLSGIPVEDFQKFLTSGTYSSFNTDARPAIPRPLSERQVIALRREIAKKASNE